MKRSAIILVVVMVTGLTFAPVVTYEFVGWDDYETIAWNDRLRPPSWRGVGYYWSHQAGGLYIPLTYTLWSGVAMIAQYRGAGGAIELNPQVFHAANVVLHVLSAVVAFDLLRRMVKRDGPACVGALLFALHPLQVEPVAWASGTKDVLCGLLALLAVRHYWLFVAEQRGRAQWVAVMVMQVLAMLAKPTAVVVPLIAGAIDLWIVRRPMRRVLSTIAPMLLLAIPCIVWSRMVQGSHEQTWTPLWTRPLLAADAIAFYLGKLVLPWPLALLYGRTPQYVLSSGAIWCTWIVPAVIALGLVLNRKRTPALLAAGAIFVAGMLPVLGFARFTMQIHSTVSDHYMYLPMFGAALAAAWAAGRYESRTIFVTSAVILAVLAGRSIVQMRTWHDSISLFRHSVVVTPQSAGVQGNLGLALARAGQMEQAIEHFQRAVELVPDSRGGRIELAKALLAAGRFEQVIPHARAALLLAELERSSDTAFEHVLLGRAFSALGLWREAEVHFAHALAQQPNDLNLAAELEAVRRQRLASPTTRQ